MQEDKKVQNRVIKRLVKRNFKKNRLRNTILILAVALVTMLMTVMFGVGFSIFSNVELANLRQKGTEANGFLMELKEGDLEKITELSEISQAGWQQYVAEVQLEGEQMNSGSENNNSPNNNSKNHNTVVMTAYDQTEWEKHIVPTISDMHGAFPKKENEVMLSEWMLKKMGIAHPELGRSVSVTFTTLDGKTNVENFTLSGYYKDYIYEAGSTPNSGNTMAANLYYSNRGSTQRAVGNMVVSEAFAEEYGTSEGLLGTCLIDDKLSSDEALDLLTKATGSHNCMVAGLNSNIMQALAVAAMPIGAVILVIIAGYLLIYNVVNISVLQEMHTYGQLKTLGATTKQLGKIVKKQSDMVALIGIPIGLLLGTLFAYLVVPGFLARLMAGNGFGDKLSYDIRISPLIYLFSILFAYFTVVLSNRKPSKLAAKVSPVEALKYVEHTESVKNHQSSGGGKLYRMAYRNVFRSKKRALVTFASLFFGLLIYLIAGSCTYGVDYEKKFQMEQPDSFTLKNLSFQTENAAAIEDLLDEDTVGAIKSWEGVEEIQEDVVELAVYQDAGGSLKPYLEEQAMYRELTAEETSQDFQARGVGIPLEQLKEFAYESTLSKEEVQRHLMDGTGIFLTDEGVCSYTDVAGKEVTVSDRIDSKKKASYTILGILTGNMKKDYRKDWRNYGEVQDYATVFYTTRAGITRLSENLTIQTLRVQTDPDFDGEIQGKLENMFAQTDVIKMDSKLGTKKGATDAVQLIKTIGTIFGIFLVFMGLVNFVNVIFTNIYSRQKELAALESIGMTQKQIKSVLMMEGFYYSTITMVLLCTLGIVIAYFAAQLIRKGLIYFALFGIPVLQLIIIFGVMLALSALVAILVYNNLAKESVVERLRKGQD